MDRMDLRPVANVAGLEPFDEVTAGNSVRQTSAWGIVSNALISWGERRFEKSCLIAPLIKFIFLEFSTRRSDGLPVQVTQHHATSTSCGKTKIVAPSENLTRYIWRSRLKSSRTMIGIS